MVATPAPKRAGAKKTANKKVVKPAPKKEEKENVKTEPKLLPEDVAIDEAITYEGTVVKFFAKKGFGFVKFNTASPVDGLDEVMVHWKEIKSDDRWPSLNKDMVVEFKVGKQKKGNNKVALQARSVTLPGGAAVSIQDEHDDAKEFIGDDKNLRYTGSVVWFDPRKGFGYVKLEEGYDVPDDVPDELVLSREEVHCGSDQDVPHLPKDLEVEFGIYKGKGGKYRCFNLTLPGGDVVTREGLEERTVVGDDVYSGTIKLAKGPTAWIECNEIDQLPAEFKTKLDEQNAERKEKAKKNGKEVENASLIYFRRNDAQDHGHFWEPGHACTFKVYVDKKGCGACDVSFCG